MRKYFSSLIIAFAIGVSGLFAQSTDDIQAMQGLMKTDNVFDNHEFSTEGKNAEEILFGGMFHLYKKFVSSQDGNQCMFTPSCSEYAWEAVRRKGMFLGMMDGFDRLSRCNGLSRELYHKHPTSHYLYDPVE